MTKRSEFNKWLIDHIGDSLWTSDICDAADRIYGCKEDMSYSRKISISSIEDSDFHAHGPDVTEEEEREMCGTRKMVFEIMKDGKWRTLDDIKFILRDKHELSSPPQSIAIYLRSFRESRYGGYTVNKRKVPNAGRLFEYQLLL